MDADIVWCGDCETSHVEGWHDERGIRAQTAQIRRVREEIEAGFEAVSNEARRAADLEYALGRAETAMQEARNVLQWISGECGRGLAWTAGPANREVTITLDVADQERVCGAAGELTAALALARKRLGGA